MRLLKRLLTPLFVVLAAIIIVIEEVLWVRLNAALAWLGRLPVLRSIERKISALPAYAAIPLFLLPVGALLPFKLAALWLIANGHAVMGIQVFILAKIVGTAIAARLFVLCRPALMSKAWFANAYHWIMALRERVYTNVRRMRFYKLAKIIVHRARRAVRAIRHSLAGDGGLKRRWLALGRLRRMRNGSRPSS